MENSNNIDNDQACTPTTESIEQHSSCSSSTTSSPPRYSENVPCMLPRHLHIPSNASKVRKIRHINETELIPDEGLEEEELNALEATSHLPTTSRHGSAVCNGSSAAMNHALDSKGLALQRHQKVVGLMHATKEEKQRQNEEIVTMETSSISSDTSSWESVFPKQGIKEKTYNTAEMCLPASSACFIDASTLLDEDELLPYQSLETTSQQVEDAQKLKEDLKADQQSNETFQNTPSVKCINETRKSLNPSHSSSSCNSEPESPPKCATESEAVSNATNNTNNLSDEEKLWKREQVAYRLPSYGTAKITGIEKEEDATEASVSLAAEIDSSDSSDIIKHRCNGQKRKTHIYAMQQIQPYSIHPLSISPKFNTFHTANLNNAQTTQANAGYSDLSYTTDYSSSSPAPSLVWSEHEQRSNVNRNSEEFKLMPETPHNSIVHIDHNTSNASSIHRDYTLSSSLSQQRDSGAYCSDATDSPIPLPRTPRRSKCDESNVIVSGGAAIEDHVVKPCDSPMLRRRTEACPIVSGGFISLDFEPRTTERNEVEQEEEVELRVKPKLRKLLPAGLSSSWVVDMSDCRKSNSSNCSSEPRERCDSTSSHKSNRSCGFYVPLSEQENQPTASTQLSKSYTAPKSAGFFVNLSQSETQIEYAQAQQIAEKAHTEEDKKPIFSLFIDIGEQKSNARKEVPASLAQRFNANNRTRIDDVMKSSASSTETLMSKSTNFNKLDGNDVTAEKPLTVAALRRNTQQRRKGSNDSSKRHSWGDHVNKENGNNANNYKRSISLTSAGAENNGLMCIIDKLPLISQTTQATTDNSVISPCTGSMSESHTNASLSSGAEEDHPIKPPRTKIRQRDAQLNQTYDKSSLASITDSLLSKDMSPASTTDTDDLTFQQDEELAIRETTPQAVGVYEPLSSSNRTSAQIMETIIETKETSPKKLNAAHTMETLHATIEKQKMLLETVNEHSEVTCGRSTFVKLSDLDKPAKNELQSPETLMSKSMSGSHRQFNRLYRDDASKSAMGRPHSWTMTRSTGQSLLNITNSVDNLRSLTRLFPHFSKDISNSLPNDMILDHLEYAPTDISGDSSLASSFSRSGMDESSISCRQPRRLGEDLLKMFLQEIATDMIVEVHGRRIRAHKCILRSRCQYFAAMLAGHENQTIVSLQGYSYSSVHFALCHIYSGASHPPDGISLMELAALADLLGLEGLKEVTAHALKINYCHNFHKPCSGCIDGILQVLPVALNHALDDLYRKCLRWTCRHYLKVWITRQFSQLAPDILARCRQQIVAYLTSETVLDTVLDCDNLLIQVASFNWGGICENLVRDILDAAYTFIAEHFASLIASDAFLSLGHDRSCHIPQLEGVLLRIAASLNADQACRSYQRVTRLNTVLQANAMQLPANLGDLAKELQGLQEEDLDWDAEYIRLVSALLSAVEQCLIRQCSRAMRVTAWQRMDLNLRKKIQTLAHLTEPIDLKRSRPVPKNSYALSAGSRNQDLYQVKLAIQAHSRSAHIHDAQMFQATHMQTQTLDPIQTTERGVQASTDCKGSGKILKSNSRAYVPQILRQNANNENINAYKRTKSVEATNVCCNTIQQRATSVESRLSVGSDASKSKKAQQPRLTDVRPRYLEPRKQHAQLNGSGPVRSATSSSIPSGNNSNKNKLRALSSSDSSRHSSPSMRKGAGTRATCKELGKSAHISLDSLATPTKRGNARAGKLSDNERYSDVGGLDSMAESLRSSIITNKTVSQESLKSMSKFSRKPNQNLNYSVANGTNNQQPRQLTHTRPNKAFTHRAARHLSQQLISTGSSPSSIATSKSAASRLSSVSSTQSSRDVYKRSISVPGQQAQRYSFLSAKSREILARRAEKNKIQEQKQQQQGQTQTQNEEVELRMPALRSSGSTIANRSSLPTNIPMRRPNTLHIKKTNSFSSNKQPQPQQQQQKSNKQLQLAQAETEQQTIESAMINSKLERSSTFCKDSPALDINQLQIIE